MAINRRLRAVIIAGSALAVVAGVGLSVAVASPSGRPRYVTASVATGDVTQTYTTSGTVTRTNTAAASFAVDGTVSGVKVAVGASVDAGEVLAVLKKGPLQLAVLEAETSVAEAKANLYAAQHPSSSSRSTGSAAAGSGSIARSGSSATSSGKGAAGVTVDPAALLQVTNQLTGAVANEAKACEPVFGAAPEPTPSATPSPSTTTSASASATPTATVSGSASATPSASETPSATPSASATQEPSPAPTSPSPTATVADQADTIEDNDPTAAELKACGEARAQVQLATAALQQAVRQLLKPGGGTGSPAGTGGTGANSGSSGSASASSTATVSAAQVASAKARLLQAEQQLQAAQDDLANAELVAPITGTVGSIGLAPGDAAGAGSVTIVGEGNAQVTFELPLKTRTLVSNGQDVAVTPAGSATTLKGTLTGISAVETSGTAGDTPTYAATVTVSDPDRLLASGAKASVSIPVKTATRVVRVPASAVTPTGTGTGTVQVVDSARAETATTVDVTTGAVGEGWVEVTDGVSAGDLVVLADNTAALPTNNNLRRTTATTRASAAPTGGASTASAAPPSAAPSATPTR